MCTTGRGALGLMLDGEEAVVGTVNAHEPRVGTAVCVLSYGKGKIVSSTLDFATGLDPRSSGADVARKLLCNYLEYGSARSRSPHFSVGAAQAQV